MKSRKQQNTANTLAANADLCTPQNRTTAVPKKLEARRCTYEAGCGEGGTCSILRSKKKNHLGLGASRLSTTISRPFERPFSSLPKNSPKNGSAERLFFKVQHTFNLVREFPACSALTAATCRDGVRWFWLGSLQFSP